MSTAQVAIVPKLVSVFEGEARYRGARGGRGSGKTRSFATMLAVKGYELASNGETGILLCARQFMNSLAESSFAEVKAAIKAEPFLDAFYECGETYIRTRDGRISFEFVGLARNLDSIKSKAKVHVCWVDEAENVTEAAWIKLLPTVREHGSEVWVTWNPERKDSATNERFWLEARDAGGQLKPGYKIVECNYRDNPRFPEVLEFERQKDEQDRPDQYGHIWEGDYKTVVEGAYFAKHLLEAKAQGRIGIVPRDPLLPVRAYCDIGGTSGRSDAFAMWVVQFVGLQVRVLDYYEAVGQEFGEHVAWLRRQGWGDAEIVLPHDGLKHDTVHRVTPESFFRDAGFRVRSLPNMGAGAASARIEAVRRLFPSVWFNEATTEGGRDALGWYHEKRDPERGIGLGPNHDWASHGSDAFGAMATDYEPPKKSAKINYGKGAPV